ncbi:PEP-CTERM sorting domain-containing protein [Massilia sp. PAMC28688]|uniref:PEP-CTERM sorting domain-containing protein n=1 Tax=Massilia sp. PAMC28688 TaxID=2861283 RepID=UPI001C63AFFC|nr:PEP-CTERM sorting domain-containing protein [Massilia sp. PAMC28688]QYF95377.1 PEP-CTERM sorting domain-containing protein [Massilia sp. PAMC28688]
MSFSLRLSLALFVGLLALPAHAGKYTMSQFQVPLSGGASALSSAGHVAVNYVTPNLYIASYLRHADGTIDPLMAPEGLRTHVLDVNSSGVAVGVQSQFNRTERKAIVWREGVPFLLPPLAGEREIAVAINDAGVIAGTAAVGRHQHAVIWDANGVHDLGNGGGDGVSVSDINSKSQLAGSVQFDDRDGTRSIGAVWTDGVFQQVGTLGGSTSSLSAINDRGWAVGQSFLAGDQISQAMLWDGATLHNLGSPDGWLSAATDIGNDGIVYGYHYKFDGGFESRAAIWLGGKSYDLHSLITNPADLGEFTMTEMLGVDASGRIYGYLDILSNGGGSYRDRMFVLTPFSESEVPEPMPLLLVLLGMGLMAHRRYR